jgi:A/G-specific adenine glycosylase
MPGLELKQWDAGPIRAQLLAWYAENRRDLPWRLDRDPYSIWVSEIMLQQTRVAVVVERYKTFLERFPTVVSLALAPEADVLALWSGLGYYRRARMLHKAAQFVAENRHGNLPSTAEELRTLPGIGVYTAAAIASIAHNQPIAVVDGNVERVLCRLAGWEAAGSKGSAGLRRDIDQLANHLVAPKHPGDFNQAMMELGATVCLPRNPLCLTCPLSPMCITRGEHRTAPRPRMLSREVAHALAVRTVSASDSAAGSEAGSDARAVLLEQRSDSQSVMPGMWELPLLRDAAVPDEDLRMIIRHAIMQVNYYVRIRTVAEEDVAALSVRGGQRRWVPLHELGEIPLTGLARKVLSRAHLLHIGPVRLRRAKA